MTKIMKDRKGNSKYNMPTHLIQEIKKSKFTWKPENDEPEPKKAGKNMIPDEFIKLIRFTTQLYPPIEFHRKNSNKW
jgi:hypothetical protein